MADVIRMEDRVAEVTVREAPPEVLPEVAEMVVVPAATAVARPLLLTVATDGFEELQVTCAVTSKLVPSEYAPVAVSCWVTPIGMLELADVTRMEDRVAEVTVREAPPGIPPEVAEMVVVPAATAVARPLLLTVATDGFDELQVTCAVTSWLVPSEYAPVAISCWVTPIGTLELADVTRMEDRVAEDTVREAPPERLPKVVLPMIMLEVAGMVAEMVVVPAATAVARPLLLTVATDGFEELQVTCAVTSWLVPSE